MSFPRYPAYTDSGVEWLGKVPEHWGVCRFSRYINSIKDGTHGTFQRVGEGKPLLSAKNVLLGQIRIDDCESLISVDDHLSITSNGFPRKGDILLTIVGTIGRSCVYNLEMPLAFQRSVCFIRLEKPLSPEYFDYQIQSKFFQEQLLSRAKAAAQGGVYMGDVMATSVCCPSLQDQLAIATFLDHETAKIDALIAEQQRLIELLQEKRQAVISHAVTKGLNPDAPMKDSGVEWLGEVPEHWEVTALKRLCLHITDGAHISPETENGVYYFVSTRDISESGIDFEGCLRTSESSYEYLLRTGCRPEVGDLLFSKDGTIGRTLVVRDQHDFVVASSLIIIRPDTELLDVEFLDFLCKSDTVQHQVESFVKGAGLPRLSIANLMRVIGIFPPLQEQRRIANVVSKISVRFTALIAEAEAAVTLLQERRSALISAAVTGQIDVRGLVPDADAA